MQSQYVFMYVPRSRSRSRRSESCENGRFKSLLLRLSACNQKTMMNCDTPRQYLNFVWTDFWYTSSFGITWPSNFHHLGMFRWWHLCTDGVMVRSTSCLILGWCLGMEHQLDLFQVAPNPTWPPAAILEISNDNLWNLSSWTIRAKRCRLFCKLLWPLFLSRHTRGGVDRQSTHGGGGLILADRRPNNGRAYARPTVFRSSSVYRRLYRMYCG